MCIIKIIVVASIIIIIIIIIIIYIIIIIIFFVVVVGKHLLPYMYDPIMSMIMINFYIIFNLV